MANELQSAMPGFGVRYATQQDAALVLTFIKGLAEYEKMADQVEATEEGLRAALFERHEAEVIFGEVDGEAVAFALFFHNFSTFVGRANLYLEDLFVKPEHRGKGYGGEMFRCLARIAVQRGCRRLDWWCLDWNVSAVSFYKKMGAVPMDEWTTFRLQDAALQNLANSPE